MLLMLGAYVYTIMTIHPLSMYLDNRFAVPYNKQVYDI